MKQVKASKAKYTGVEVVRMDKATTDALNTIVELADRNKSDAMRWSIRQMAAALSADKKLSAMKSKGT